MPDTDSSNRFRDKISLILREVTQYIEIYNLQPNTVCLFEQIFTRQVQLLYSTLYGAKLSQDVLDSLNMSQRILVDRQFKIMKERLS